MLMKQLIASDERSAFQGSKLRSAVPSCRVTWTARRSCCTRSWVWRPRCDDPGSTLPKNDRTQVIARSRVSHVDVRTLMRDLGGGGHHGAAAATFKNTSIDEVRARIEAILRASPLSATRVRDLMSTPVLTFDASQTLEHAKSQLQIHGHSGAPVLRGNELVGIVSRRDIARAERTSSLQLPVASHMTHHVECIDPDEPVEDALDLMTERDVGRLPVVRNAELLGILTRSDVLFTCT
ncbi:MAG: CBS domain-containing protein [bacterium]